MPSDDFQDSPLDVLEKVFARENTSEWLSLFDDVAGPAETFFKLRLFAHQYHMLNSGSLPNRFRIERLDDCLRYVYAGRAQDVPDPDLIDGIVAKDGRIETFRVNGKAAVDAIVDLELTDDGLVRAFLRPSRLASAELVVISESIWAKPEPKLPRGFKIGLVNYYALHGEFTQSPAQAVLSNGATIDLTPTDLPVRTRRGQLLARFALELPVDVALSVSVLEIRVSAGDWIVAEWPTVELSWRPNCPLAPLLAAIDRFVPRGEVVGTMEEYLALTGGRLLTVPIDGPPGMWTEHDSTRLRKLCDRLVADTDPAALAAGDRVAARDEAEALMRESYAHVWSDWEVADDRAELIEGLVTMTIAIAISAADTSRTEHDYAKTAEAAILLATFDS